MEERPRARWYSQARKTSSAPTSTDRVDHTTGRHCRRDELRFCRVVCASYSLEHLWVRCLDLALEVSSLRRRLRVFGSRGLPRASTCVSRVQHNGVCDFRGFDECGGSIYRRPGVGRRGSTSRKSPMKSYRSTVMFSLALTVLATLIPVLPSMASPVIGTKPFEAADNRPIRIALPLRRSSRTGSPRCCALDRAADR